MQISNTLKPCNTRLTIWLSCNLFISSDFSLFESSNVTDWHWSCKFLPRHVCGNKEVFGDKAWALFSKLCLQLSFRFQ